MLGGEFELDFNTQRHTFKPAPDKLFARIVTKRMATE